MLNSLVISIRILKSVEHRPLHKKNVNMVMVISSLTKVMVIVAAAPNPKIRLLIEQPIPLTYGKLPVVKK